MAFRIEISPNQRWVPVYSFPHTARLGGPGISTNWGYCPSGCESDGYVYRPALGPDVGD
jgi:hypothetical protein